MASAEQMTRAWDEASVRAQLRPYGWTLRRLRRHNRDCPDAGAYLVADPRWGRTVFGYPFGASLAAIGTWLTTLPPRSQGTTPGSDGVRGDGPGEGPP